MVAGPEAIWVMTKCAPVTPPGQSAAWSAMLDCLTCTVMVSAACAGAMLMAMAAAATMAAPMAGKVHRLMLSVLMIPLPTFPETDLQSRDKDGARDRVDVRLPSPP